MRSRSPLEKGARRLEKTPGQRKVVYRAMDQKPGERMSLLKLAQNRMAEAEYIGGARLQVAIDHGFVPTDLDSSKVFCQHSDGNTLSVNRYGNWIHTSSSGKTTEGWGWENLRAFLESPNLRGTV
jgi:hypothetical protein